MSVYLGNEKIGVSQNIGTILDEGEVVVTAEKKAELNAAVNKRVGEFDTKSIPQMIEALKKDSFLTVKQELEVGDTTPWTRPQDWPDLDSLNLEMSGDTDFIYMTYDSSKGLGAIGLDITGQNITVTIGHITSGTYVIDETITNDGSNNYIKWLNANDGYVVVKITGSSITTCQSKVMTDSNNRTQVSLHQPIIERIAYVPHLTTFGGSNLSWSTVYLEHEKINNGDGLALTNASYAYAYAVSLKSIDLSGLRTSNVTSLYSMFYHNFHLNHTLDLRHFDVKKATSFSYMFYMCAAIPEINLTGWTTSALTGSGLYRMFSGCRSVKYIYGLDSENFTTNNCTDIREVFSTCYNLRELNLSNWDISKCNSLASIFSSCYSLKDLSSISNWNTSNITSLSYTFNGCYNIETLDLSNWNVNKVTNVEYIFGSCMSLKQLNISGWTTNKLTSIAYAFSNCMSLKSIDLTGWRVEGTCQNMYYAFYNCCSAKEIIIPSNWDLTGLTNTSDSRVSYMFYGCYSLKKLNTIGNWNFSSITRPITYMFYNCYSLEELDVSNWNVSTITNMANLFNGCYSLKALDVSNWNTGSCTNFSNMFYECRSLQVLNVSNFDMSKATTLNQMFFSCRSLKTIGNITNWNISNVTVITGMFRGCYSLKTLDLSNWDVKKVTDATYMFAYDYCLTNINLTNWNLTACKSINYMFNECWSLTTLNTTGLQSSALTVAPANAFGSVYTLQNYNGFPIALDHTYASIYCLSYSSIIAILNTLPTVSTTRTLKLNSYVLTMLTATDRAIATSKGWTITT